MPSTQEWAAPRLAAKSGEVARPGYSDTSASEYLDTSATLKAKVKAVAALIRSSNRVVVYTGAGISTASGIGDYASKAQNSIATKNVKKRSGFDAQPTLAHERGRAPRVVGRVRAGVERGGGAADFEDDAGAVCLCRSDEDEEHEREAGRHFWRF